MPRRSPPLVALFAGLAGQFAAPVAAQAIVAQTAGIPNPTHVFDFGANALPNFTPVSTQFAGLTIAHASYFTTGSINNLVGGFLTNDFTAGPPSTLRIQLAQPVVDASFVFHQVASGTTTTMRALLQGVPVASFTGSWNQAQPNNHFGFANTLLDELRIDFVSDFNFDTLAVRAPASAACAVRNGSGVNPLGFGCLTLPQLGTQWQGTVITQPNTLLSVMALGYGGFGPPLPLFGGELLLDASSPLLTFTGMGSHGFAIPPAPGFLGVSLPLQGARLDLVGGAPAIVLLNGLELIVGT
ncbi:MAG: hypothetical protein FJ306_09825 [Planctomycetes bacterium]|nr:hypothetical protein [Planctomycetota bacterium]